ncbi:MAG: UDP-N-acetylmuramoyl-L-alanyl-D-glutamate--2,6-diaminopimelate ligase [Spirochaetales bacterium]|nr:UDP-N-acetylmuramoyl-L-alanyl-D-glutamate--2,6-diaminopimelate ligase [Spirochaetales bacterium]
MKLSALLAELPDAVFSGVGDPVIRSLDYDSRRAGPGSLFVALRGVHADGHRFLKDAAGRGAAALLTEDDASGIGLPWVRVKDARAALSRLSARFFGEPSRHLYVIGVTGTDGKSTTVSFIHQLLEALGYLAGFLSTVAHQTGGEPADNPFRQSTPEAPEIHSLLAAMRDNGKRFAVVEATSHGLSARTMRLADVFFDAAALTNVALEHLEFHGSLERYRNDKANLFRALSRNPGKPHGLPRAAVVNADDAHWRLFADAASEAGVTAVRYAVRRDADWRATDLSPGPGGASFSVRHGGRDLPARLAVPGDFNVENFLAAAAVVCAATGRAPAEVCALAERLKPVRGRLESVARGQPFRLVVDFAHTPQAFGRLLPALKRETAGRLIVVFGSAGERDTAKRRLQGEAAARAADVVILADEDPRGENPAAILEEIAAGCAGKKRGEDLFLIPDRREAIGRACALARPGDTVALLGKGHEKSIAYKDGARPWDEKAAAEEALKALGFAKE